MGETRGVVCDGLYDSSQRRCPSCFGPEDELEKVVDEPTAVSLRRPWKPSNTVVTAISLTAIVIASAVLRFWQIGRKNLWLDELFSVSVTSHGPLAAIRADMADTNPPLYYMIQSMLSPILGRSDGAMRVFPAAAGVLSVIIIYLVGRRMFGGKAGLWAAALFAVAPLAVQYSQEARMYSLLMLACSLELLAFAALVEKPTLPRAALLSLALAGVAYTHVYGYMAGGFLLLPVVAIPRLRKRVGRMFAVAVAGAGVIFLPWAFAVPAQIEKVRSAASEGNWWMDAPSEVYSAFVGNLVQLAPSVAALPAGLFLGLVGLGAHAGSRITTGGMEDASEADSELRAGESIAVLLTVALVPVFIGLVVSKYVMPIATLRNSLVALPALCLLAARGALRLPRWASAIALGALIVFSLAALPKYYADPINGQWHEAAVFVLQTDPRPVVLTENYENSLEMATYADILGQRDGVSLTWVSKSESAEQGTITALAFEEPKEGPLREYLATQSRLFVISTDSQSDVDSLLATLPDWHREWKREFQVAPYIRLWTRSRAGTSTP